MTTEEVNLTAPALPNTLPVEITSHCNLKCRMCPLTTKRTASSQQPGHITDAVWTRITPIAQKIGQMVITGFGEPFVHPRCLDLLAELDAAGVRTSLSTNGVALTPQSAEKLARLQHFQHINISIDTPDSGLYRQIRGRDLRDALQGVKHLMAKFVNPARVTISSVLMHSVIASLPDFPALLAHLGIKNYVLQGFVDYNPQRKHESLVYHAGMAARIEAIKAACAAHNINVLFSLPDRLELELSHPAQALRRYYGEKSLRSRAVDLRNSLHAWYFQDSLRAQETRLCWVPWEIPFINKDGLVFPCCYAAGDSSAILGDLTQQGFEEIWHGEKYSRFRQSLLYGDPMPKSCQHCTTVILSRKHSLLYAAKLIEPQCDFSDQARMRLVVQNTGECSWTRQDDVLIGTADPFDHPSPYEHPGWRTPTRIATFCERVVHPGQTATFLFQINPRPNVVCESFQLVVENKRWLPNTRFEIRL